VVGSQYGFTCPAPASAAGPSDNGTIVCQNLTIAACADRTIYCTYPPDQYPGGEASVTRNPSPTYKTSSGT
jgi:hypothetical protein